MESLTHQYLDYIEEKLQKYPLQTGEVRPLNGNKGHFIALPGTNAEAQGYCKHIEMEVNHRSFMIYVKSDSPETIREFPETM